MTTTTYRPFPIRVEVDSAESAVQYVQRLTTQLREHFGDAFIDAYIRCPPRLFETSAHRHMEDP